MTSKKHKNKPAIDQVLDVMATLRSPTGCPWDREQDHRTLRYHAVEEVYELLDAVERGDDREMMEELGDLLLQVVFHCQLAKERKAFDFERVCRTLADKLIRRHPHVFGDIKVKTVDGVWAQWEKIKRAEKKGTRHERASVLDGIPAQLPALMRAEKLIKKAIKGGLMNRESAEKKSTHPRTRTALAGALFDLAQHAQRRGWNAEDLLRTEVRRRERGLRVKERNLSRRK